LIQAAKAILERGNEEQAILQSIAIIADHKTAEEAAERYAAEKHAYSFDGYLYQLNKLKTVLAAGVSVEIALECVDSCIDERLIMETYRVQEGKHE